LHASSATPKHCSINSSVNKITAEIIKPGVRGDLWILLLPQFNISAIESLFHQHSS
jgi:hypothetical protein